MDGSLRKKAVRLEYFTVGYNIGEGIISVAAGLMAGSIALVGFGLDSAVESASGGVLIWRLTSTGLTEEEEERVERRAVRLVGVSLLLLAGYVLYESAGKLITKEMPEPSLLGIGIAAASLIIMPLLARAKLRTAREMGSRSLEADSTQTFICSLLSAALLVGLGANYLWGLWWADPAAGLVIVVFIVKEGVEAFREGKACSC